MKKLIIIFLIPVLLFAEDKDDGSEKEQTKNIIMLKFPAD